MYEIAELSPDVSPGDLVVRNDWFAKVNRFSLLFAAHT